MDPLDRFLRQLSPQRTQALLRVTSSTREGLEQALDGQKKRQRPGDGHFRPPRSRERYGATKQIRRSKIQHPHSKELLGSLPSSFSRNRVSGNIKCVRLKRRISEPSSYICFSPKMTRCLPLMRSFTVKRSVFFPCFGAADLRLDGCLDFWSSASEHSFLPDVPRMFIRAGVCTFSAPQARGFISPTNIRKVDHHALLVISSVRQASDE